MARVCQLTGKKPRVGHKVSHANNKTKRRFLPNLQNHRIYLESEDRWVSVRITNAGLRSLNKNHNMTLTDLRGSVLKSSRASVRLGRMERRNRGV